MSLENQNEALTRLAEAISNLNSSTSQNSHLADAAAVSAVSVKLPEFWPEDPEVWFIRVEAQLRSRSVTQDQTKFDYVVASLDNSTAAEVKAVLLHPLATNKYDAIKEALLGAFGKTQAQKDAELFNISGLGDRTPSALLRKLESLNNNADTLRRAFLFGPVAYPSQIYPRDTRFCNHPGFGQSSRSYGGSPKSFPYGGICRFCHATIVTVLSNSGCKTI